jgi:hypothetical protein
VTVCHRLNPHCAWLQHVHHAPCTCWYGGHRMRDLIVGALCPCRVVGAWAHKWLAGDGDIEHNETTAHAHRGTQCDNAALVI